MQGGNIMFAYSVQFEGEVNEKNIWTPNSEVPRYLFVKPAAHIHKSYAERHMWLIEVDSLDDALALAQRIVGPDYDPKIPQPRRTLSALR
jgi:hypothetical protein